MFEIFCFVSDTSVIPQQHAVLQSMNIQSKDTRPSTPVFRDDRRNPEISARIRIISHLYPMQVVLKGINTQLSVEKVKCGRIAWKTHYQWHSVPREFFLLELDNAFRIRNKMQFVFKKMTRDRAKSNMVKWNLNGGIRLKHEKKRLLFM